MKQQEVLELLIEKTESGEIEWYKQADSYGSELYYGGCAKHDIANPGWLGNIPTTYKLYTGLKQILKKKDDTIITGILILRDLESSIKKQVKQREQDKLSKIYHEILTK